MTRVLRSLRAIRPARRLAAVVATAVVVALGAAGVAVASGGNGDGADHHLTAYFTRTIGLYQGNDVRILGVKVGTIDKLTVVGTKVKVDMTVESKYQLSDQVRAVVVPPSVVSDRFIQLTPAYTGGATLPEGAVLDTDRTAVPLEFDEIFQNLDRMNVALGPKGANKSGALSRLVDVSAKNLGGNGEVINGALKEFSTAISTLAGSRTDLFTTVRQLQQFTTALAQNDGGVRALNANLEKVGTQLAGERQDLGAALANLSTALQLVSSFVAENRSHLTGDIHKLTSVTGVLSKEQEALKEIIDLAPVALTNLALAGDPKAHTLDTKDDSNEPTSNPTDPNGFLCQLLPQTCGSGGLPLPIPGTHARSLSDLLEVQR